MAPEAQMKEVYIKQDNDGFQVCYKTRARYTPYWAAQFYKTDGDGNPTTIEMVPHYFNLTI